MNLVATLFVLLVASFGSTDAADTTIVVSFAEGSGNYNPGETVTLKCVITTEEAQVIGYTQRWYKRQDGDFILIGGDDKQLVDPFLKIPSKYMVDVDYDKATKTNTFTLMIHGVESVDIGEYKCDAGYYEDEGDAGMTESDTLSLGIVPEVTGISFVTDAPSENSVHIFNIGSSVRCSGESASLSPSLRLVIKQKDGTDLSQDFERVSSEDWTGEEGLKMPTTSLEIRSDNWMPAIAGQDELSCFYEDGERQLAVQTFEYKRDETASINCSSNYANPVTIAKLDIYITCQLNDYSGDMDKVQVKWIFQFEGEEAYVDSDGVTKHLRTANYVDGKYVLFIPTLTTEMASYGARAEYKIQASTADSIEPIAETTYGLRIDPKPIKSGDSGSSSICYSIVLLVMQLLILLQQ